MEEDTFWQHNGVVTAATTRGNLEHANSHSLIPWRFANCFWLVLVVLLSALCAI